MKYKMLSKRYDDLEQEVLEALREEIEKSKKVSDHTDTKVLKVNVFDYEELTIINGELTFMDSDGLHYGLYTECSLEDLIDILRKI
jgi:hypothetical protein